VAWLGIVLQLATVYIARVPPNSPDFDINNMLVTTTRKRSGQYFSCKYCGDQFYRRPSHIRRGITKSCGKSMCKSASMSGEGNPYWGKTHNDEVRAKMKDAKPARPSDASKKRRYGPKPGSFSHTPEARKKIAEASRKMWAEKRDMMLASLPRGKDNWWNKISDEPRYRLQFTPLQRREWKDEKCGWCAEVDDLVLDHIIPVMSGGKNIRENAQTLCRKCNMWKRDYVDRPFHLAKLAIEGG
jgi:5-methylcytosine-specific restriction endonuclease McrA